MPNALSAAGLQVCQDNCFGCVRPMMAKTRRNRPIAGYKEEEDEISWETGTNNPYLNDI